MRGPTAAALALAACGLLLLGVGQPWATALTQAAPGAPRWPGTVSGAELVPWLGPVVLVAGLCVVAGLAGLVRARYAALPVLAIALLGTVLALTRAGRTGEGTVSSHPTAWPWVALGSALVALLAVVLWRPERVRPDRPAGPRSGPGAGWEQERRRTERVWLELSRGEEPDER
ncbi:hypothetical protein [Ornithinimicrobium avium]|uniref:Uncharacterized protein n=1 Tax=Ornithinimicrobium avium TaxID=2283195 RepID=A0A345NJ98_9MICO|nr:hypothetical protein [Ornithinimicrobium avium]AXH95106.1 hypothetical protein DV701_02100 [Ornithinimicrobium avium]